MEGDGCKSQRLTGATVFSHHRTANKKLFKHKTECTMTFYAAIKGWKLMLRMIELDIPDRTSKGICNDAVYIYDHKSVYANGMDDAGGQGGICGNRLPPTLYSTDSVMTVHFRSDATGPRGKGFKFIITAINPAESTSNQPMKNGTASKSKASCGLAFRCNNNWCIDKDLICDRINHCGDYSDESSEGRAKCDSVLNRFMTLGVTAAVAITVGSIVIFIVCIVAIICCCKKSACKKADPNSITTTATSVVTNGGVTPFQGKINKANPPAVFTHAHQGYHPIQPSVPAIGPAYTPLTRESYTQSASPYSSQPTSCHRSATPTSSKSAKSNRSNQSVTFSQGTEKLSLPVNV
ncbi:low-density lipoprotein receptor-related 12-like [Octopus vulgaris]|uniref:Low-density lipoprotein receptor-related 12-like n=1 Tax=Octopus vulgaris TaxID=6645 RepID=A0AA36FHK2_OCTVU|nr:low-density lipoprotein receptor-related 12-like [Octopus vulgaris]